LRRLLPLLATVALASGCAAPVVTATSEPIAPASIPAGTATVPDTLRFAGKTLDGAGFDAATMAGKPTILWFWAPWCATCARLGDNKAMHEFVSDLDVGGVPHLDDQAGKIWKKFKITQQSTYVFLDRTGRVVKTGYLDDLQLTAEVKTLVA
jgi:thiol-disulfide isomerase/thioredoxin